MVFTPYMLARNAALEMGPPYHIEWLPLPPVTIPAGEGDDALWRRR